MVEAVEILNAHLNAFVLTTLQTDGVVLVGLVPCFLVQTSFAVVFKIVV